MENRMECRPTMIRAYKVFPWIAKEEEGEEYYLRNEASATCDWFEIDGTPYTPQFGLYPFSYINPRYVVSANDGFLYDCSCVMYSYCHLLMESGEKYYLAGTWLEQDVNQEDDHDRVSEEE